MYIVHTFCTITMFYKLPKNIFKYFRTSVRSFDEFLRTLGLALIYKN